MLFFRFPLSKKIQLMTAGVNFINVKHARFLHECHFGSFFCIYVEKSCRNEVHVKMCTYNVDEIDGRFDIRGDATLKLTGFQISPTLKLNRFVTEEMF